MLCMLVAGLALQSQGWGSSLSGSTQPSILPGPVHEQGGTLGLPGRNSWALLRVLNLGANAVGQGATAVVL